MGPLGDVLDRKIRALRSLGGLTKEIAPRVAALLERDTLERAKRQVGPDGKPWPPTSDGRPALRNVDKALRVRSIGTTIVATLEGHVARHGRGWVRGGKARKILPTRIPSSLERAIRLEAEAAFRRTMGGW